MFREEVVTYKKNPYLGTVFINTPIQYRVTAMAAALCMLGLLLLLMFGKYSEKFMVIGFVNSSQGMLRVYPTKEGTIMKSYAVLNQSVKAGEILFVINTSESESGSATQKIWRKMQQNQKALEREIQRKSKQLQDLKPLRTKKYISLDAFNLKQDELSKLKQDKRRIEVDVMKFKQAQSYVIHAPKDGIVTSVSYYPGQHVGVSKSLVSILPKEAQWIAEIFVPVQQVGFLQQNHPIRIRYDAYPYEHFGTYRAVIDKISQSILTDEEDTDKPIRIGQPYYKVFAHLNSQYVNIYGHQKKLKHGMTFSAMIAGPKKRLWRSFLGRADLSP